MNIDELAMQAKTDDDAFRTVLQECEYILRKLAGRYQSWYHTFDDLMQDGRYLVWWQYRIITVKSLLKRFVLS